ncbi:MAG: hypothetical protein HY331_19115 [Chloroflexi bacterium]|nr:hypothetical protein [Chloroflexota bacterium]
MDEQDERRRCAARSARTGRRCGRVCRPGEEFCAGHSHSGLGPADLYLDALPAEHKGYYQKALAVEGLDGEIALLRVLILTHVDKPELVIKAVTLLARTVATRYRFSKAQEEGLYESLVGVLRGIGDIVLPEGGESNGSTG